MHPRKNLLIFLVAISSRSWKYLLPYSYNENVSPVADNLHFIEWGILKFKKIVAVVNFNTSVFATFMERFFRSYHLERLIKGPTNSKNIMIKV